MSDAASPHDFTPPEIEEISALLPAYEVLSFIAKGGMGAVYLARQKSLDRQVAIKILPRHFGEDEDFRASFETEAKSMAKLNHPNLIGIYDFGQVDGLLYIIMEMVQGKSLYHSAYGKTIDPQESARIVAGICRGLANAHSHGILHRDIKPANILLDPSASPKIGDFGLARPAGEQDEGVSFGTPGYAAPEVIHNPAAVDESSDIYAVGIILYELLTGGIPEKAYVPAASMVGCNAKFDQIIRKAINPSPALRFQTADEMAEALEPLIKNNSQSASPLLTRANSRASSGTSAKKTLVTHEGNSNASKLRTAASSDADGAPAVPSSTTPPVMSASKGEGISFVRNIIIITALLAAIYIAWEGYQAMSKKRMEENDRITEENKKAKADALKKSADNANKSSQSKKPKKPRPPVVEPPKPETPLESLARLRYGLKNGKRIEFPKGNIKRDGRIRFYVPLAMSWHQATRYCERHGGHLAILPDDKDLAWFSRHIPAGDTVWLGAGTAGNDTWAWIDGTPWAQKIRKTSRASYVSTDSAGVLNPQPASTKNTFFIEWLKDGSSPASLKNQLKRTGISAASPTPRYPAGTITYDNRHFLLVAKPATWSDARSLADLAGGILAVPSNRDENQWMLGFVSRHISKDSACWIGAYRNGEQPWKWATGESWTFASWAANTPDDTDISPAAAAITANQDWNDFDASDEQDYLLIEWSNDASSHQPSTDTPPPAKTADIEPLRNKCITLIKKIQTKYNKLFRANIKSYELEISSFKRGLPKGQQEDMEHTLLELQSRYPNGKIPKNLPTVGIPNKLSRIIDFRLSKQLGIEREFFAEIESLRAKYRATLAEKSKELGNNGLRSLQRKIQEELEETLVKEQEFITYMTGEEPEPDEIEDENDEEDEDGDDEDDDE